MQKIQQMSTLYQQQQLQLEQAHKMLSSDFSIPLSNLGLQMVDERNKRGRPPKKPKAPEVEAREKELLQQKIMMQVQQGFKQQALKDGVKVEVSNEGGNLRFDVEWLILT